MSGTEELCVCDIIDVLGITQSKASRHLRYLYHLGWVTDRRDGLWMNYRLAVTPGSPGEKLLKLLEEILAPQPEAQALRGQLAHCLEAKRHSEVRQEAEAGQKEVAAEAAWKLKIFDLVILNKTVIRISKR